MKKYLYFILFFVIGIWACSEDTHKPITKDDVAPGQVSDVTVKNLPGGALLQYSIPDDRDLLYVKADYKLSNGKAMSVKASVYSDSLKLVGFGDTSEYKVSLTCVDRSENESEVTEVIIKPLKAPIEHIFESLNMRATFGGINLLWENEFRAPVAIKILQQDTVENSNDLIEATTLYTEGTNGDFSLRGYEAIETDFYCVIRDRWNNYSDTLHATLTPLFELELNKGNFEELFLPGDTPQKPPWNSSSASTIPKLWDGKLNGGDYRITGLNGDMPDNYYFTFDLGVIAKLSRFKLHQFLQSDGKYLYFDAQYRKFEIWGCTELDYTGGWDNWSLIKDCEIIKPSGKPNGLRNYTNEDKELAIAGHDFEIPLEAPEVRYIRIKVKETFGGLNWAGADEITFWGEPKTN